MEKPRVFQSDIFNDWFYDYAMNKCDKKFVCNMVHSSYHPLREKIKIFRDLQLPQSDHMIRLYSEILASIDDSSLATFAVITSCFGKFEQLMDSRYYVHGFDAVKEKAASLLKSSDNTSMIEVDMIPVGKDNTDPTILYVGNFDGKIEVFNFWEFFDPESDIDYTFLYDNVLSPAINLPIEHGSMASLKLPCMKEAVYGTFKHSEKGKSYTFGAFRSTHKLSSIRVTGAMQYCLFDWLAKASK